MAHGHMYTHAYENTMRTYAHALARAHTHTHAFYTRLDIGACMHTANDISSEHDCVPTTLLRQE